MTAETTLDRAPVNVRIKLSALWTSTLFIFAYVDLFSLYRPDSGPTSRQAKSVGSRSTTRSSWEPPPTS